MATLEQIADCVIRGRADKKFSLEPDLLGEPGAKELTEQAVEEGILVSDILTEGILAAMDVVGTRMKNEEMFIPEVLQSGKAAKAGLAVLRPHLINSGIKPLGKIVIGSVAGDVHDIGKSLVGMVLEGAGFEVIDLGVDVSAEQFVSAVKTHKPDILGLSSMLTTTMRNMAAVIKALQEAGLRDQVKTIMGGAPTSQAFAETIGADGHAANAGAAVDGVKWLLKQ